MTLRDPHSGMRYVWRNDPETGKLYRDFTVDDQVDDRWDYDEETGEFIRIRERPTCVSDPPGDDLTPAIELIDGRAVIRRSRAYQAQAGPPPKK